MSTPWRINVFGVRHLSPAGAWHLRRYLDEMKPKLVLIEGLADATELIPQITRKGTKPPIALLAYTDSLTVRSRPLRERRPPRRRTLPATSGSLAGDSIFG